MKNTETVASPLSHSDSPKAPAVAQPTLLTFADLGLSSQLVEHLAKSMSFVHPTPIQVETIPQLLKMDGDFIGLAPTGTGKTAAFGLPLIEALDPNEKTTQALVLCPTRELALQVSAQLQKFGQAKGLRTVTIYGGASYRPQVEGVKRGAHIIIATPGRLVDMLDQEVVKLGNVKTVILDEADEMVSMGFKDDLERILSETQSEGQSPRTWLFSATMSPGVRKIAQGYLKTTGSVEIKGNAKLSDLIQQCHYAVFEKDKAETLLRVLQSHDDFYGLIFCQTKAEVADLARFLTSHGYPAEAIHGDKTQADREKILGLFKRRQVKALVATDVAARGLDIKDLTHVVNHSLPWEVDTYVHRIGRTGRNGQKGIALNLISPNDVRGLHRLQSSLKVHIPRLEVPSAKKLAESRLLKMQAELLTSIQNEKLFAKAQELVGTLGFEGPLLEKSGLEVLAAVIASFHKDLLFQKEIETFSTEQKSRGGFARGSGQSGERSFGGGRPRANNYGPRRYDRGPRADYAPRGEEMTGRPRRPSTGFRSDVGDQGGSRRTGFNRNDVSESSRPQTTSRPRPQRDHARW